MLSHRLHSSANFRLQVRRCGDAADKNAIFFERLFRSPSPSQQYRKRFGEAGPDEGRLSIEDKAKRLAAKKWPERRSEPRRGKGKRLSLPRRRRQMMRLLQSRLQPAPPPANVRTPTYGPFAGSASPNAHWLIGRLPSVVITSATMPLICRKYASWVFGSSGRGTSL